MHEKSSKKLTLQLPVFTSKNLLLIFTFHAVWESVIKFFFILFWGHPVGKFSFFTIFWCGAGISFFVSNHICLTLNSGYISWVC